MAAALGRAIRVLRTEQGLNRKELAEASGISYPYLSEIEAGKKQPSSKVLLVLAQALGVSPSDFMALAEARVQGEGFWTTRTAERDRSPGQPIKPMLARARSLHAPAVARDQDASEEASPAAPASLAAPDPERAALEREVHELAEELPTEDLARLVDLARRLRER